MKWLPTLSLFGFGAVLGAGFQQAFTAYTTAVKEPAPQVEERGLAECRGELMQYMALGNKLFYEMAGGPNQVYWEDPFLYLPNDARLCNEWFDPIACAKTEPGTFTFELKPIFDGTLALVPVVSIPPPPPPVFTMRAGSAI